MKHYIPHLLLALLLPLCCASCDDTKTYADMLEEEEDMINSFISSRGLNILSENGFDPSRKMGEKDYVLFTADGVYLHIDSVGHGPTLYHVLDSLTKRNSGYRMQITVRFLEYSLSVGDLVFYSYNGGASTYHVAMYIGGGQVIHANGIDVCITGVYYDTGFIGGGSIL